MKNIFKTMTMILLLTLGVFANVQAEEIKTQYITRLGNTVAEYKDGSFKCMNENKGVFEFTPINDIGDYNYSCNNKNELDKLIESYNLCKGGKASNEFYITKTYNKVNGDVVTEYNDNSWSLYNLDTNTFIFMPAITEDTEIQLNSMQELNNIIATYKSIKVNGYY